MSSIFSTGPERHKKARKIVSRRANTIRPMDFKSCKNIEKHNNAHTFFNTNKFIHKIQIYIEYLFVSMIVFIS